MATSPPLTTPTSLPTLTPTSPIRPAGEVPDSQDDNAGHSSDFEDLMEEGMQGNVFDSEGVMETKPGTVTEGDLASETGTDMENGIDSPTAPQTNQERIPAHEIKIMDATSTSPGLPPHYEAAPTLLPTIADMQPEHEKEEAMSPPPSASRSALSLPSKAAHTVLLTNPPVSGNTTDLQARPHNPTPPPEPTTTTPSIPALPAPSPTHLRLLSSITHLQSQLHTLQSQLSASNALLPDPSLAPVIVKKHITLLHDYNAIKDIGLGLMGMIAEGRGVRVGDVLGEMGVRSKD